MNHPRCEQKGMCAENVEKQAALTQWAQYIRIQRAMSILQHPRVLPMALKRWCYSFADSNDIHVFITTHFPFFKGSFAGIVLRK
jgi:hypothetical protein